MVRYIKLYFVYISRSIQARLEYKADAFIGIFSFLLTNVCSIFALAVMIQSINTLDGWNMYMLGFLYGMVMLVKSIDHLFTDALWFIGYWYIPQGKLDKHLVRPVHPLFQIIAETIQFEALGELILGVLLISICGTNIDISWDFSKVFLMIICLTFGAGVITGLKLIKSSIALWTKRSGQVMSVVYGFSDCAKYPMSIFKHAKGVSIFLLFIVPFGLIMSVPVEYIIFGTASFLPFNSVYGLIGTIVLSCIFFVTIGVSLFNLGLKCYESAGN